MWRLYAREIAADLRFRGVLIADWHRGTRDKHGAMVLSSRQLIELIEALPETSAYQIARGTSGWPEPTEIIASMHNLLAEFVAGHRDEGHRDFGTFLKPADRAAYLAKLRAEAEDGANALEKTMGTLGFT